MTDKLVGLLIEMSANTAKLEADLGRATRLAKREAAKMKREAEEIKRNIENTMKAMAVGALAAVGSMGLMIKKTADLGDTLDKMSKRLGVSVEFLSKYDHQASLTGTSLGAVDKGVTKLQKSINDSINGLSTATRGFDALGLSAEKLKSLKSEEAFELVSERLGGLEDQSVLTGTAMDLLGRSGTELINLFKQTPAEVKKANDELVRFGALMSTTQATQGAQFNDALQSLSKNAEGFGNILSNSVTPALTEIINQFNDSTIRDANEDWQGLQTTLATVYGSVLIIKEGFAIVGNSIGVFAAQTVQIFNTLDTLLDAFGKRVHVLALTIGETFVNDIKNKAEILGATDLLPDFIKNSTITESTDELIRQINDLESEALSMAQSFNEMRGDDRVFEESAERIKKLLDNIGKVKNASTEAGNAIDKNFNNPLKDSTKLLEENSKALDKARGVIKKLTAEHRPIQAMFEDLAQNMEAINSVRMMPEFSEDEFKEGMELLEEQAIEITESIIKQVKGVYEQIPSLFNDSLEEIEDIDLSGMFDGFASGLNPAISALQSFKNEIKTIDTLFEDEDWQSSFYKTGITAEFALNSMANMAEEGSEAQKKLQAAAAITNTILGIAAILEQGKGDPYTAFARMAAMAAMVASMGVQVAGAFGGSGGGGAEQQQATQGTGTVLGYSDAKSESMINALDIIASASEKIVGINSGMLRSLNAMNNAISGTVTQIAQGGEIGNLGTTAGGFTGLGGSSISGFINSFLFGKSKVTDRGISILSGSISDAINGDLFQAYENARRSGLFGSSSSSSTAPLEEGVTNQISLIFQSMQDAVLAGAEALGINSQEIQSALDSYQIEAQRISLLDLDSDEQQAELAAVFSSIFDGLVSVSIPFITQFQEAGEGLGETLARVSTTVLVFEEAIDSMGLDFIAKELDPELFAQAAVAISDFAGGMEGFIDGYTNYISNFLSDGEQLEILGGRINGVFEELGISLPQTRDGFIQLIQGLDLTTEAGQEAFGTLIGLSNEIDSFYSGLDDLWENYFDTFFTSQEQLQQQLASATVNRDDLLGDLGLDTSISTEAFREIFESVLPTLSAEAVAQWLQAAEALGLVIDLESQLVQTRQELTDILNDIAEANATEGMSAFALAMRKVEQELQENLEVAYRLGASERELAMIRNYAARQQRQLMQQLEQDIVSLSNSIFGTVSENITAGIESQLLSIESQITLLEQQQSAAQAAAQEAINAYNIQQQALAQVAAFAASLLTSEYSPLNPAEQLAVAQSQFDAAFQAAAAGDVDALNSLQGLASTLLGLSQDNYSSSDANTDIFNYVLESLNSLGIGGGVATLGDPQVPEELQALYDLQAQLLQDLANVQLELYAENILIQEQMLFDMLQELAEASHSSIQELAERLGIPLDQLVADLGINLPTLIDTIGMMGPTIGGDIGPAPPNVGGDVGPTIGDDATIGTLNTTFENESNETQDEIRLQREAFSELATEIRNFMSSQAA